jgi:hypothetical protein
MKRILAIFSLMFAGVLYFALAGYSPAARAAELPDIVDVLRAKVVACARLETPQRMPPGVELPEGGYFCNAKGSDFDVTFFELARAHHGEELMRLCTAARDKCIELLIARPHQRTLELIHYGAIDPLDWSDEARSAAMTKAGLDYEAAMKPLYVEAVELCKNLKREMEEPFIWVGRVSEQRVDYSMTSADTKFGLCFQKRLRSIEVPPAPRLRYHELKGGFPVEFVWQPTSAVSKNK